MQTTKRSLVALKDFTDKHGRQVKKGQRFEASEQEAQEYAQQGQAQETGGGQTGSSE